MIKPQPPASLLVRPEEPTLVGDKANEWDVLRAHVENAEKWKAARDQLNALIDWFNGS